MDKTDNKSMDKYIQEMVERKETIEKISTGTDYILWLMDFTKDKKSFFDSDWDYSDEKLSEYDQERVNNLSLFFEGIYSYAKKNHIYSSPGSLGEYYQIKIYDIGFEIGYITGQGTSFYCKRIPILDDNFIDFIDIMNNKEQDNVEYINNSMQQLSNMIIDLYNNGVPLEAIDTAINIAIKEIGSYQKENRQKVYK